MRDSSLEIAVNDRKKVHFLIIVFQSALFSITTASNSLNHTLETAGTFYMQRACKRGNFL